MSKYDELIQKAFDESVKETVLGLFKSRWGYDDGAQIVATLKAEAEKMLREDPDVKARLKKRLLELIERGESRA